MIYIDSSRKREKNEINLKSIATEKSSADTALACIHFQFARLSLISNIYLFFLSIAREKGDNISGFFYSCRRRRRNLDK